MGSDTTKPVLAADIWLDLFPVDPHQNSTTLRRSASYSRALKVLAELNPEIYLGHVPEPPGEEAFRALYDQFAKGVEYDLTALRFFYRGVANGNRLGIWNLPTPFMSFLINREKNILSVDSFFNDNGPFRKLSAAFLADLENPLSDNSRDQVAQLLLSGILFGGLVDKSWVQPWLEALEDGLRLIGRIFWIEMRREGKTAPSSREFELGRGWSVQRRWVADPLSQLLLIRWVKNGGREALPKTSTPAWAIMKSYLERLIPAKEERPKSLNQLLRWAIAGLNLKIPPYLRTYASGGFHVTQLPIEAWLRILTGKIIPVKNPERPRVSRLVSTTPLELPPKPFTTSTDQYQLLKQFKKLFSQDDHEKVVSRKAADFCNRHGKEMEQPLWLLTSWAQFLLDGPSEETCHFHKTKLVPSTVRRYLDSIGMPLISILDEDDDLMSMDSVELEELYEEISDYHCGTTESSYCLTPLASYHWYLCHLRGEIDDDLFVNLGRGGNWIASVDANILLPKEYDRAKRYLGEGQADLPREKMPPLLALILGYRCSLRRSEVAGLRLGDLEPGPRGMLKVRAYQKEQGKKKHRLKRRSSVRWIPLWVHLTPEEITLFYDWRERRLKEPYASPRTLLFSELETPEQKLKPDALFGPVTEILKIVTGDQTFRFHHLRRSCAQHLLWSLDPQIDECFGLGTSAIQKNELLGGRFFGRSSLYAICNHLGHSSPDVTVRSYLHLLDLMLGCALAHPLVLPVLTPKAIANVKGRTVQAVYASKGADGAFPPLTYWIRPDRDLEQVLAPEALSKAQKPSWSRRLVKKPKRLLPSWEEILSGYHAAMQAGKFSPYLRPVKFPQQTRLAQLLYQKLLSMTPARQAKVVEILKGAWKNYDPKNKHFSFSAPETLLAFLKGLESLGLGHTVVVQEPSNFKRKEGAVGKGQTNVCIRVTVTADLEAGKTPEVFVPAGRPSSGFMLFVLVLLLSQGTFNSVR